MGWNGLIGGFGAGLATVGQQMMQDQARERLQAGADERARNLEELRNKREDERQQSISDRQDQKETNIESRRKAEADAKISETWSNEKGGGLTEGEVRTRIANQSKQDEIDRAAFDAADIKSRQVGDNALPEKRELIKGTTGERQPGLEKMQDEATFDEAVSDFENRKKVDGPTGLINVKAAERKLEKATAIAARAEEAKIKAEATVEAARVKADEKRDSNNKHNATMLAIKGGKGDSDTKEKPLTADKALERGTMLMKNARDNTTGDIIDQDMYDNGKKFIEWAKAKSGIPADKEMPQGSFDGMLTGKFNSDTGNDGPRANKTTPQIVLSSPVKKNGVVGYRQPDGSVRSASGKRLN